jgi:hypothetical protein
MAEKPPSTGSSKAKYITLALLLAWVAAVFVVTMLKFAKVL